MWGGGREEGGGEVGVVVGGERERVEGATLPSLVEAARLSARVSLHVCACILRACDCVCVVACVFVFCVLCVFVRVCVSE